MAEIRIEQRNRRSLWPWLIGLLILALLMWAIAELVSTDRDNKTMVAADSAGAPGANAVGAGPSQPGSVAPAAEASPDLGITPVGALVPLGVQHAGQTVRATGQVLSTPAHGGFWLRAEGNAMLWVRSSQRVKKGESVPDLVGTLQRPRPGEMDQWLKDSDLQSADARGSDSQPTLEVYLDATSSKATTKATASAETLRAGSSMAGVASKKR